MAFRQVRGAVSYGVFLIVLALVGAEVFLRFLEPEPQGHFIWPPHMHVVFQPSDESTPGISGPGHFTTNSLGLRSDEPLVDRERTIYVFGGSTAIDVYLDQREAWVTRLQDKLNAMPGQPKTWVGNLARSSMATLHNLLQFEYLIPELPKADLFVNLVGVNDLQLALKSSYLPDMTREDHMSWTFTQRPSDGDFWERLAVVRFYGRIRDWIKKAEIGVTQTYNADGFIIWRRCRQAAPEDKLVREMPDLTEPLATYRRNLNELADRAAQYGAPTVFLTQPTIWSDQMRPEDKALLLAAGLGPNNVWCEDQRYFSAEAMANGMAAFNEVLRDVCRERGLICVDLAARVAKSGDNFFDDMHFNEQGADLVATIVAEEIAANASRLTAARSLGSAQ